MRLWVLLSVLTACQAASHKVCTGDDFTFDLLESTYMISRQVFFTPKSPLRPARMVMDESKTLDPQFRIIRFSTVKILSVTKDYEGVYSVVWPRTNKTMHTVTLVVNDCPINMELEYGGSFSFQVHSRVQQIDYSPSNDGPMTVILWNRTKAVKRSRGTVENGMFVVKRLTQTDEGFYTARDKEGLLLTKYRIKIKELHQNRTRKTGEDFTISFPLHNGPFSLTYQRIFRASWQFTLIKDGHLEDSERFEGRIELLSTGVEIRKLEDQDGGTFKLRDRDGNVALVVTLTVTPLGVSDYGINYIVLMGAVVVVIVICLCCVKCCCCKKRNSTTSIPVTQVYQHEITTIDQRRSQPYAMVINQAPYDSRRPLVSAANNQPQASDILSPPPYNLVVGGGGDLGPSREFEAPAHVGPIPFQGSAGGGVDAPFVTQGFDCLSSDSGTQFEIPVGLNYPSAPPLSSDTPSCDVYTSDKLNFR